MAKKCMKCGGAMKMAKGGTVSKPFAAGIPYATGAGATDGKNGMMRKGGAVKKMADGGFPITKKAAARKAEKGKGIVAGGSRGKGQYVPYTKAGRKEVKETGGTEVYNLKPVRKIMKVGGMVKNSKLAALAAPKNKITRADVIVGAKRNARKK